VDVSGITWAGVAALPVVLFIEERSGHRGSILEVKPLLNAPAVPGIARVRSLPDQEAGDDREGLSLIPAPAELYLSWSKPSRNRRRLRSPFAEDSDVVGQQRIVAACCERSHDGADGAPDSS
jgi:hypothetical protein